MSTMGMTMGVMFYVAMAFVFVVSFTSICYELSPYSRRAADVALPDWERKTLYSIASYPPLSILLLIVLAFSLPGGTSLAASAVRIITWFCIGHIVISVLGAAGAWYLRRRNKRNTVYFVSALFTGCLYACGLIALFLKVHQ